MFKKRWAQSEVDETDLNLTPFIDMMVTLIPFLLLSVAFVRVGGLETEAPSSNPSATALVEKSDDRILTFKVEKETLRIQGFVGNFDSALTEIDATFPVRETKTIATYVMGLEKKVSKVKVALFYATPETVYEDAVGVMNVIRSAPFIQNLPLAVGLVE